MSHTFAAGPEQLSQQIDHIIKSHSLRGSESLCKLLQYLAKQSLYHPEAPLKEYQIATEVYGRPADFDPQTDSTIRVQAGRLRLKLADYYATEGAADPIVVRIPKGSYHLTFETRSVEARPIESGTQPQNPPAREARSSVVVEVVPPRWRMAVALLLAGLVVSLIVLGSVLSNRRLADSTTDKSVAGGVTGPLADFWRPFTSGTEEPWVIFSNAAFVGRPETGMRYYNSSRDSNVAVYDHYTGVGEVLAIHALDEAFGTLGRKVLVKRGSLFTLDDVKNNNLIFVGSPSENLSLLDIPNTQEFVFQRVASGNRKGDLSIVSKHPKPGEAGAYLASPSDVPLTEDYAVVGLVPGVGTGRYVMILAGTTTFGTQGAVEFVCRQESVEKLLREIPDSKAGVIKPFEALVRVKIARGVPVESELVAVRGR
ncbi:MAG TPA: helix-turn-helix domain-containing protein [Candidatus Sulfotelmatobacter sp.]|nr:helix-turn-helix domain-containing protein [Candidatus Sulfotelmatobacter sp.]